MIDGLLRLRSRLIALKRHRRDARRLANADAVFVSFPKSGRTWVRTMLSRLGQIEWGTPESEILEFDNLHTLNPAFPRILFTHDIDAMVPASRLPADKSHYFGRPVAFLARHPADVVVSRYFHLKHRSRDPARRRLARAPIEEFVWTEFGGLPAIVTYLNQWVAAGRNRPDFLLQRYEDFLQEPRTPLAALARHFGIPASNAAIDDAVAFASFDSLKKKETEGFFSSHRLHARTPGEPGASKVRSGRAGGWREHFDGSAAARIEAFIDSRLDPLLGYNMRGAG